MRSFRPILNSAGLTEQQWRVLRTLYDIDTVDALTLADRAQVLPPSLTRILRLLDKEGLIERHADPKDMRRQVICLSTTGRNTVKRVSPQIETVYQRLEAAIGPELLALLYQNIDTMMENVDELNDMPRQ